MTCCLILALAVKHIYQLDRQAQYGMNFVAAKKTLKVNLLAMHIGVTLAFTITQTLILF